MDDLAFEARGVGAILITPKGQVLMQLRDHSARVSMAGHWSLFGGMVEKDEEPRDALLRELREELHFTPLEPPTLFTQLAFDLRFAGHGLQQKWFFEVPILEASLGHMHLAEGEAMALFTTEDLILEKRVVPWDLYGVLLYARRQEVSAALRARSSRR